MPPPLSGPPPPLVLVRIVTAESTARANAWLKPLMLVSVHPAGAGCMGEGGKRQLDRRRQAGGLGINTANSAARH